MSIRPSSRTRVRGLSIMELVVACAILGLLSTIFVMILGQVRTSSEGGAERIALRAVHRQAQQRIGLVLRSAIAPNEVDPALVEPSPASHSSTLRFHAPADLLDPSLPFDPRTPDYPEFTLLRDASSGGLVLRRSDGTGISQLIGRDFTTATFQREAKSVITVVLVSHHSVRGASAKSKELVEETRNSTAIPGLR